MSTVASPPARSVPAPLVSGSSGPRAWAWTAAGATAAAGVLHVIAGVDHLAAGELVVSLFLVTALGQLAAAGALAVAAVTGRRPDPAPLTALLAVTVALLGLYLVAHTTDLLAGLTATEVTGDPGHEHPASSGPVALGGTPGQREPPGMLGTATVTVELVSVLALIALLPPRRRRLAGDVLVVLGGATWLLWLTGPLG